MPTTRLIALFSAACAAVGVLAACTSSPPPRSRASAPPPSPGSLSGIVGGNATSPLQIEQSVLGPVLADSTGFTVYWFSQDTPGKAACLGSCVSQWPPLTGVPKPAPGVSLPGTLGSFVRSDGARQATYDGHPLYTYAGDPEPGEIGGSGLFEYGGTWYAMTVTGAKPTSTSIG